MKFLARLALGFVMCSVGLCAVAGGVEEGFGLLLISVVCTAGLGLLVWIPLWWVVGWLTLSVAGINMGKKISTGLTSPMERDADVVAKYIKDARGQGMGDEDIDKALRLHGWREEFIQETKRRLK